MERSNNNQYSSANLRNEITRKNYILLFIYVKYTYV